MSRSRSRSRGRAAERGHARRPRSRSHSSEKGDGTRSSRRERSRSASAGRERSRSRDRGKRRDRRSPSPRGSRRYASDASTEDSEGDSKQKKRHHKDKKLKKSKKSKKESKSSKRSGERSQSPSPTRHRLDAESVNEMKTVPSIESNTAAPLDAKSFFAQLQQQEASKEIVGTLHASGSQASVSATMNTAASEQWECGKAGCGHKNFKHAPACNKCGAMKRLSEWR